MKRSEPWVLQENASKREREVRVWKAFLDFFWTVLNQLKNSITPAGPVDWGPRTLWARTSLSDRGSPPDGGPAQIGDQWFYCWVYHGSKCIKRFWRGAIDCCEALESNKRIQRVTLRHKREAEISSVVKPGAQGSLVKADSKYRIITNIAVLQRSGVAEERWW